MISPPRILAGRLRSRAVAVSRFYTTPTQPLSRATVALDDHHANSVNQNNQKNPMPDFDDAKAAYDNKTTRELVRAASSFALCRIPPLVRHSDRLLKLSYTVLGDWLTNFALKSTLFGHFCAGEDEERIKPTVHKVCGYHR